MYTQQCGEMLEKKNLEEQLLNIQLINRIQSDKSLYNPSGVVNFFGDISKNYLKPKKKCVELEIKNEINKQIQYMFIYLHMS